MHVDIVVRFQRLLFRKIMEAFEERRSASPLPTELETLYQGIIILIQSHTD